VRNANLHVRRKRLSAQVLLSQWDRQLQLQSEAGKLQEQAAKVAEEDVVEDKKHYRQNVNKTNKAVAGWQPLCFMLS
jgi:hypothetical protein